MKPYLPLFISVIIFFSSLSGKIVPDSMFSDNMVLQSDLKVPVWGTADPGEKVTVLFRNQSKEVKTGKNGRWQIKLDKLQLGPPSDLVITGKEKIAFKNVLVGEVWLGSGQSNMAGSAGGYAKRDPILQSIIEDGPYSNLRIYVSGKWEIADSKTMPRFSAIHLSFGYALQQELKIPVGLFYGAVGGTPSGRWLSMEMAMADKKLAEQFKASNGYSLSELESKQASELAKWEKLVIQAKAEGKRPPRGPVKLGDLYQSKIEHYVPFAMRGVLWDQGESKTRISGVTDQYVVMNALIKGWRKVWGQGDFPFLHVQKPSGGVSPWNPENPVNHGAKTYNPNKPSTHYTDSSVMSYPLDHIKMGTLPNAPLVTALDLGTGVHPSCKSGYGSRASRIALGVVYGRKGAVCGPVYKSHQVEGQKIRIHFTHTGKGLDFRHAETLEGFEICGEDGKWEWANAKIENNSVLVSHPAVSNPKLVQYAFNKDPSFANLYNKDGFPALPFTF